MGGRGTFAINNHVEYQYKTVGKLCGVKILEGIGRLHNMPVESHTSSSYIMLSENGTFKMMRFYNENHYLIKEIAYHPERKIDRSGMPILHLHEYKPGDFSNRSLRLLTQEEYEQYKKYFGGELRWKTEK